MLCQWVMFGVLATSTPGVELHTVDSRTVVGEVSALSAGQIVLKTAEGEATLKLSEVLSLAPNPAPEKIDDHAQVWIELTDGSRLTGQDYAVSKKIGKLKLSDSESLEVPPRAIHWVRFSGGEPKTDALWTEALKSKSSNDVLAVRKKDTLDFLEGTVGSVMADKVEFELDKEPLEVKRSRVDGVIFAAAKNDLPDAVCTFEDATGWRLQAKSVLLENGVCKITTVSGVTVSRPLAQLARLDYSSGKVRLLSDMEWESAVQVPFINFGVASQSAFNQPRRDRAFEAVKLSLGGTTYAKGVCLKSRTTLVVRLPSGARTFKAVTGIDDSMHGAGHVRLVIMGDNQTLFDEVIGGKDPPRTLDLKVAGAARLKILVDYGEDQDVGDHLDLCDARIQK